MTDREILAERENAIVNDALDEVQNQLDKWGEQTHPDGTGGESAKREADVARALCENNAKFGTVTWKDILNEEVKEAFAESNPVRLREELIQVIAVGISWVRALDGRPKEGSRREAHTRSYVGPNGVAGFLIDQDGTLNVTEELLHDLLVGAGYVETPNA